MRGGSWINNARNCRSAYRNRNEPSNRNNNIGFRFAQLYPPVDAGRSTSALSCPLSMANRCKPPRAGSDTRENPWRLLNVYHLLPNRNFEQHPPAVFPPLDAVAWGFDFYGLWKTLNIAGVMQTMRWIPPGEFMMGSPQNEPDRDDDEDYHKVKLTQGFWLADTACSQELWQALTGNNPSNFQGVLRPVESVSWLDVMACIEGAGKELSLGLPTEAQWEYACRAGTTTPFNLQENIDPESFNYDGNYPYGDAKQGRFRQETVDVKLLEFTPNYWGLWQMHGNVWEWCSDWYEEYERTEFVVNPTGPADGGHRVLRGGSWINDARLCRSACRLRYEPSSRDRNIGFRFAQVDQPRSAGK